MAESSVTVVTVEGFLDRFVAWASARPDVRGALLVGSRARTTEPADALSDIDVLMITTRPRLYASTTGWLRDLGEPILTCTFSTVVGRRAVRSAEFDVGDGPLHVDFAMVGSFESRWAGRLLRIFARYPTAMPVVRRTLRDEIASWFDALRKGTPRVLIDKDGTALGMLGFSPPPATRRAPTAAEFDEAVQSFLDLSLWQSKLLLRGERWMAVHVCDHQRKERLLRMLEWQVRATRGPEHETWYTGRFVERWADPRVATALGDTFGRYDEEDQWRALFATIRLFSWVARETAEALGFPYPSRAEERVVGWLDERFTSRPPAPS